MRQIQAQAVSARGESGPSPARRPRNFLPLALGALSLGVVIVVWWGITALQLVSTLLLPTPWQVLEAFAALTVRGILPEYILVSLLRILAGFLMAAIVGIGLGVLMGRARALFWLISPLVEVSRPIPPIALLPLVIIWFGIGESARISVIFYGALFPILLNSIQAVQNVDANLIRAAKSLGASDRQVFAFVILPAAFPTIVTGLRLGAGIAFLVLVAAELLAASSGIGYMIMDARDHLFTDRVMVGIIVLGLLGSFLNKVLLYLEARMIRGRAPTR